MTCICATRVNMNVASAVVLSCYYPTDRSYCTSRPLSEQSLHLRTQIQRILHNYMKSQHERGAEGTFLARIPSHPTPGSCEWFDKNRQTEWHHIAVYSTWPDIYFKTKYQSYTSGPIVQTQWQPPASALEIEAWNITYAASRQSHFRCIALFPRVGQKSP